MLEFDTRSRDAQPLLKSHREAINKLLENEKIAHRKQVLNALKQLLESNLLNDFEKFNLLKIEEMATHLLVLTEVPHAPLNQADQLEAAFALTLFIQLLENQRLEMQQAHTHKTRLHQAAFALELLGLAAFITLTVLLFVYAPILSAVILACLLAPLIFALPPFMEHTLAEAKIDPADEEAYQKAIAGSVTLYEAFNKGERDRHIQNHTKELIAAQLTEIEASLNNARGKQKMFLMALKELLVSNALNEFEKLYLLQLVDMAIGNVNACENPEVAFALKLMMAVLDKRDFSQVDKTLMQAARRVTYAYPLFALFLALLVTQALLFIAGPLMAAVIFLLVFAHISPVVLLLAAAGHDTTILPKENPKCTLSEQKNAVENCRTVHGFFKPASGSKDEEPELNVKLAPNEEFPREGGETLYPRIEDLLTSSTSSLQ